MDVLSSPDNRTTEAPAGVPITRKEPGTTSNALALLTGQGGVYLVNFVTTVILSRRLGPSVFGVFVTLMTLRDTAAAATALMVNLAILAYREEAVRVARASIGILLLLSLLFIAGEVFLFVFIYRLSADLVEGLVFLSLAHMVGLLNGPYSALLQLRNRYRFVAGAGFASTLIASACAVAASFFLPGIAALLIRETAFSLLVVVLLIHRYGSFLMPVWNRREMKRVLRLSLELWASRTAEVWIDRRDKVNVGGLTSIDTMAVYNLAKYLAELSQLLLNPLTVLLFDRFSDPAISLQRKREAADVMLFSFMLGGLAGAAVIEYAGEYLVVLLYGREWGGAGNMLRAFIGYFILYPTYIFVKNAGYAENRARIVVATQVVYLGSILAVPLVSTPGGGLLSPVVHLAMTTIGIAVCGAACKTIRSSSVAATIAAALATASASSWLGPAWTGGILVLFGVYTAVRWRGAYLDLRTSVNGETF
ncbi:MAG: oligosaccharide flippase family protein [Bacteroidota bacterium]|nr:oligosaccharide flippase family protein [Bacteroidota bacterium]